MATENRPAILPEWATTAVPPDIESAPSGKIDDGWIAGEAPPHDWFNFLLKNDADWVRYLDQHQTSLNTLNWEQAAGGGAAGIIEDSGAATVPQRGGDYDPISKQWLSAGGSDGCQISNDDARNFADLDGGMSAGVSLQDCAIGATSSAVCIGDSTTMYQRATILSGSWGTVTAPGSPTELASIVYDTLNTRHIVVGNESGNEPYVATANNPTGTAFTDRSGNVAAGFDGLGLGSLAVNAAGVAVAGTISAHTKLAYTTDGGINFLESTTTLVSGVYDVAWSEELGVFVAVRIDDQASNDTYVSPDGNVWTLKFSGAIGFDGAASAHDSHAVAFLGHAIVVGGHLNSQVVVGLSSDLGVTWDIHRVDSRGGGTDTRLVASRTNGKVIAFTGGGFGARSARVAAG